jgi:hypothetical protein
MNKFATIAAGALIGFSACAPLNAMVNRLERGTCEQRQATHTLVTAKGFWGTERRCVDRRWL